MTKHKNHKRNHGRRHHDDGYRERRRHRNLGGGRWRDELEAPTRPDALAAGEPKEALEAAKVRQALEAGEAAAIIEAGGERSAIEGTQPLGPREEAARELRRFTRHTHRAHRRARGHGGRDSHSGQGRILRALALTPRMTQRDLTFILGGSRQGVAEALGKLEEQGLLTRKQAVEDRRVTVVELTEEGRSHADDMAAQQDMLASLLDELDDDEVENLTGYLQRLNASLGEALGAEQQDRGRRGERRHRGRKGYR